MNTSFFNKEDILQIRNDVQIFKRQALMQISTIAHNQPLLELDSPHLTEATNSPAQTPTPPPPTHTQLPTNLTGVPGLVHGI